MAELNSTETNTGDSANQFNSEKENEPVIEDPLKSQNIEGNNHTQDIEMDSQGSESTSVTTESPNIGDDDDRDTAPAPSDNEKDDIEQNKMEYEDSGNNNPVLPNDKKESQDTKHTNKEMEQSRDIDPSDDKYKEENTRKKIENEQSGDTDPVHSNDEEVKKENEKSEDEESGDTDPISSDDETKANEEEKKQVDGKEKDMDDKQEEKQKSKHTSEVTNVSSAKNNDDWRSEEDSWPRPWRRGRDDTYGKKRKIVLPRLSRYSSFDTEQYRNGYPNKADDLHINHNYEFYTNERPSYPQGARIDDIHKNWWGNYELLEFHHSYIQWLFPIRETGLNWYAKELQPHEVEKIIADKEAHDRVLKSYEMMLDFYGLKLKDRATGDVERSSNWKSRFQNLNYSSHNYLRITRILKCLGEFEFEHMKTPLVKYFLREAIVERTLVNTLSSCLNYWVEVIKSDSERESIKEYAEHLVDHVNKELDS